MVGKAERSLARWANRRPSTLLSSYVFLKLRKPCSGVSFPRFAVAPVLAAP